MNHAKTQKVLQPMKTLEAAYSLLLILLVLVLYTVLLFRRKKNNYNAFSCAKNTARGVSFLLRF